MRMTMRAKDAGQQTHCTAEETPVLLRAFDRRPLPAAGHTTKWPRMTEVHCTLHVWIRHGILDANDAGRQTHCAAEETPMLLRAFDRRPLPAAGHATKWPRMTEVHCALHVWIHHGILDLYATTGRVFPHV